MATQEHIAEQLRVLLSEELKVISYKWLARKFGLPCNVAKQTLFAFLEQHRGKVQATYLLAGWTTTEPRQHTVQLVDSEHLSTRRSALDPVTSMHVYSLQPTQPKDASELWNHDAIQTAELFQELRLGQTNCLADNRWSAVKCLEAKHDPSLAKRAPKPAAGPSTDGAAAEPSKAAPKAAPNSAVNQIAGIMAGSARQGGVATASVAVKGSGSSSIQGGEEAVPMERDSGTTATAPAGAPPLTGPPSGATSAAPAPGGGKKKGGKSRLANMWSKAPAVKEKPQQPAKNKAQTVPAVDADAALRSAQQAGSCSDSEEEDVLPMKRTAQQRGKRIEEEEEEEDDSPVKPAGRQAKKAKTSESGKGGSSRARRAVQDDSEDEQEESAGNKASTQAKGKPAASTKKKTAAAAKKASAKKAPVSKPPSKRIESDEEESDGDIEVQGQETQGEPEVEEEEQAKSQAGKGKKANKRAAVTKPGTVKAGEATGPKRRKVTRTTINDKGEEVTEQVWEDSQEASPSQQTDSQPEAAPAADGQAGKSPEKAPRDDALKEQPGNGVANAGKPSAAKPSKPSKPTAPATKKGKAAVKDQRGIMSFFAKK